jgi:hypothetical protein
MRAEEQLGFVDKVEGDFTSRKIRTIFLSGSMARWWWLSELSITIPPGQSSMVHLLE